MANGTYMLPAFGDGSSYVKIADGTLIQWGFQGVVISPGSSYVDATVTYPVAFHSSTNVPYVIVSNAAYSDGGTGSQANVCIPTATNLNNSSTKLTSFKLRVWKQQSVGTQWEPEPTIAWVAIGRWK